MIKKKVLIICNESLLRDLIVFTLEKLQCEVELVDNPRDAVKKIEFENYNIVVIGENKGTVVKSKLAEIIYNKSKIKPQVVIFKRINETIPKEFYLTTINKPTFHEALLEVAEKEGIQTTHMHQLEHIDLSNYIKLPHFKKTNIVNFFKNLKGNIKFHIKSEKEEILGFTMGADIFILKSTLDNIHDILLLENIETSTEPLNLNEFLSLTLDTKTFKSNLRDFIINCVDNINNKEKLLEIIPEKDSIVTLKAPSYIVKQINKIKENIDIDKLNSPESNFSVGNITENGLNIDKFKALVCMYILNMIEIEKPASSSKYDVKIKKSFLKKIIDRIRGL